MRRHARSRHPKPCNQVDKSFARLGHVLSLKVAGFLDHEQRDRVMETVGFNHTLKLAASDF